MPGDLSPQTSVPLRGAVSLFLVAAAVLALLLLFVRREGARGERSVPGPGWTGLPRSSALVKRVLPFREGGGWMAQTGGEQTDLASRGEDRRQVRLDVRLLWNSSGKVVELAPKKITRLTPPGGLEFHFSRSRPAPSENLLFHHSSCAFGAGPSLSWTDLGAQRPADPTRQPQPSRWPRARPAPMAVTWEGRPLAPARGGAPPCCSGGPGAARARGEGEVGEEAGGRPPVAAASVAPGLGSSFITDGCFGRWLGRVPWGVRSQEPR